MSTETLEQVLSSLTTEDVPQDIDFNAPEPGAFTPAFTPGTRKFIFHLIEPSENAQPFEAVAINGKNYLQVNFIAEAVKDDGSTVKVAYQRASTYKTEKMANSKVGELIRSLGLQSQYQANLAQAASFNAAVVQTLQEASGRAAGNADFGWTAAFKDSLVVYRTSTGKKISPRKDGGYTTLPWPRNADGSYQLTVSDPATGQQKYGNLEIVRFRLNQA